MSVIIKRVWNQNKMVNIESLHGMAFQAEDGGHVFEISGVNDAGEVVPLSGTVAGVFMRADRADIALIGAASGGVASVTLTDDCYAVPGRFGLTIFVTEDGKKTAVYAAVGTVSRTSGGGVAGDTPQDVVDLINAIEAAVATIPADYTGLIATVAPTYSSSSVYAVGSYAWYNGDLYRCTTPITTAETWTAAHWTAATVGSDLSKALKGFGSVASGNANDYKTIGAYFVSTSSGVPLLSNLPENAAGMLYVFPADPSVSNGLVIQIYALTVGRFYSRYYSAASNAWKSWKSIGIQNFYNVLPANDANSIKKQGIYFNSTVSGLTVISNVPKRQCSGTLIVIPAEDGNTSIPVFQVYILSGNMSAYKRYYSSSSNEWSNWIEFSDIKDMSPTPFYDLNSRTDKNATFTYNPLTDTFSVSTSAAVGPSRALFRLWYNESALPSNWNPGDSFYVQTENFPDGVSFSLAWYLSGGTSVNDKALYGSSLGKYTIPSNAVGALVLIRVDVGKEIPVAVTFKAPTITDVLTNYSLTRIYENASTKRRCNMLVFGSSYSYSDLGYLPPVLNSVAPEIDIKLGICYLSGGKMSDHVSYLQDNTLKYTEYSEWDNQAGAWVNNANTFSAQDALNAAEWDYILIQPSVRVESDYYDNMSTMVGLILDNVSHPVSLLLMLTHPRSPSSDFSTASPAEVYASLSTGKEKSDKMYELSVGVVEDAMAGQYTIDFLPCGTAIENAWTVSAFQSLGDSAWLCKDTTGHLQNGIAPLISAYGAAVKICDMLGIPPRIFNCDVTPTDAWLTSINLYTASSHGSCVGVSAANKRIGQRCAMAAFKKPLEVTTIS